MGSEGEPRGRHGALAADLRRHAHAAVRAVHAAVRHELAELRQVQPAQDVAPGSLLRPDPAGRHVDPRAWRQRPAPARHAGRRHPVAVGVGRNVRRVESPPPPRRRRPRAAKLVQQNIDFTKLKHEIDQAAAHAGLSASLQTTIERRGLVVRLLTDKIAFDSGSAALKPEVQPLLKTVTGLIVAKSGHDRIAVEGYTDSVRLRRHARYPTNWELSGARASSVTRWLIRSGMRPGRLSASGYSYLHPIGEQRDGGRPAPRTAASRSSSSAPDWRAHEAAEDRRPAARRGRRPPPTSSCSRSRPRPTSASRARCTCCPRTS